MYKIIKKIEVKSFICKIPKTNEIVRGLSLGSISKRPPESKKMGDNENITIIKPCKYKENYKQK